MGAKGRRFVAARQDRRCSWNRRAAGQCSSWRDRTAEEGRSRRRI